MLVFVVFYEGLRIWKSKKIDTKKIVKYLFQRRILKHQKQPFRDILWKCFCRKLANL